jgi:hypothetical protein
MDPFIAFLPGCHKFHQAIAIFRFRLAQLRSLRCTCRFFFLQSEGFHHHISENRLVDQTCKSLKSFQLKVNYFNGDVSLGRRLHRGQSMEHLAQIKREQ